MKEARTKAKSGKVRTDLLLVQRGMAASREQAQALIMAGQVYAPSGSLLKAGTLVTIDAELEVRGKLPYVSRGGTKLAHALDHFSLEVDGLWALDVGASTGGFTDCLLQRGAAGVYALDVGHGQLAHSLRQETRVMVMEGVNAHYSFALPEPVDIAVVDVSFISLTKVVPNVVPHLRTGSPILALVKPQFEARKGEVPRGGVIKDTRVHALVLGRIITWAVESRLRLRGLTASPILGDRGNREFFLKLEVQ